MNVFGIANKTSTSFPMLQKIYSACRMLNIHFITLHPPYAALCKKIVVYTIIVIVSLYSCFYVWTNSEKSYSTNPASRLSTIESLVNRRTFAIDHSIGSDDSFLYKGKTYSTKPILLPTIGAIFYVMYQSITGTTELEIRTINLFLAWVPHIIFLVFFFLLCRKVLQSQLALVLTYIGGAVGNIMLLYATGNQRHTVAATIITIALYLFLRIYEDKERTYSWWGLGFCLGLVPVIDPPYLAFSAVLSFISLYYSPRSFLLKAVPFALIPIAVNTFLLWLAFGKISVAPYNFAQSIETPQSLISKLLNKYKSFNEPRYLYIFNITFGSYGIFITTPLLLFGFLEGLNLIFTPKTAPHVFRLIAYISLAVFSIVFIFYVLYTADYGGMAVSLRWLIPCIPFLLLLAGMWLERSLNIVAIITFIVCIYFGAYHNHSYKSAWSHAYFQGGDPLIYAARSKVEIIHNGFKKYSWPFLYRPFSRPKRGCCNN